MNSNRFLAAATALILAAPSALCAAPNMQDGLWEITSKMDIQGMPMVVPPTRHTQCLTQKEAIPHKTEKNQDCKMTSTKIEGNTVSWTMQCRGKEGSIDSTGKITYSGTSFNGAMHMTSKMSGEAVQVDYQMSGKRIGNCK